MVACGILVPGPGFEPASPALGGGFLTTGPPGKFPWVSLSPGCLLPNITSHWSLLLPDLLPVPMTPQCLPSCSPGPAAFKTHFGSHEAFLNYLSLHVLQFSHPWSGENWTHFTRLWNVNELLVVKNPPASAGDKRPRFDPCFRKTPWRRKWQPTPVFLPGKSHGQWAWWATVHGVTKSCTWLNAHTQT